MSELSLTTHEVNIMESSGFHCGLADLPNQEGFRFRGWLKNGDLIPCQVAKNELGMHFAVHEETRESVYDSLKGWTAYR